MSVSARQLVLRPMHLLTVSATVGAPQRPHSCLAGCAQCKHGRCPCACNCSCTASSVRATFSASRGNCSSAARLRSLRSSGCAPGCRAMRFSGCAPLSWTFVPRSSGCAPLCRAFAMRSSGCASHCTSVAGRSRAAPCTDPAGDAATTPNQSPQPGHENHCPPGSGAHRQSQESHVQSLYASCPSAACARQSAPAP